MHSGDSGMHSVGSGMHSGGLVRTQYVSISGSTLVSKYV